MNLFCFVLQSGCCKPSEQCQFTYVSATNWTKTAGTKPNPDCQSWDNAPNKLCFDCQSCKAGLLDNVKSAWKKVAVVNIIFLVFLIIVYSVGCCALRNNKRDGSYGYGYKPWRLSSVLEQRFVHCSLIHAVLEFAFMFYGFTSWWFETYCLYSSLMILVSVFWLNHDIYLFVICSLWYFPKHTMIFEVLVEEQRNKVCKNNLT